MSVHLLHVNTYVHIMCIHVHVHLLHVNVCISYAYVCLNYCYIGNKSHALMKIEKIVVNPPADLGPGEGFTLDITFSLSKALT